MPVRGSRSQASMTARKAAAAVKRDPKPMDSPALTKAGAASRKRRAATDEVDAEDMDLDTPMMNFDKDEPKPKRIRSTASNRSTMSTRRAITTIGEKINDAPTQVLDIYVFGEGTSGELGLGSQRVDGKKPIDVKRPRLNHNLSAAKVGVVQISCGGMHAVALTHDNKILTWGVNDQGALGRDTDWDGGLKSMDAEDSDSENGDDTGMNPWESTPMEVNGEAFIPGTKFVQVCACDSASFALTEDGRVYGWGTFRSSDGILGFTESTRVQLHPAMLPTLKNITAIAAGSNHVLALDNKGNVVAWGSGQQNQLGRRIIERNKMSSLIPQGVGLPRGRMVKIACGSYHSFAIDKSGNVWGWGLNNFGEIGVDSNAGEDEAVILKPVRLDWLKGQNVIDIDGGIHHSLACTATGELYTWGRVDGSQVGFLPETLSEDNVIRDERGTIRILVKPQVHKGIPNITSVAAGSDNSFAVASDGKVYSWGFSSNYQTGQGSINDVPTPTLIDNSAIRGKLILGAQAGGQYSVLFGKADDTPKTNGATTNGVH